MSELREDVSIDDAKRIIHNTNGRIFGVTFTKKDGTKRDMTARLGVTKHLKGDDGKGRVYDPKDYDMVCVFDTKKEGYRTIPFQRLLSIRFEGKDLDVV